jgi:hypothetical protein
VTVPITPNVVTPSPHSGHYSLTSSSDSPGSETSVGGGSVSITGPVPSNINMQIAANADVPVPCPAQPPTLFRRLRSRLSMKGLLSDFGRVDLERGLGARGYGGMSPKDAFFSALCNRSDITEFLQLSTEVASKLLRDWRARCPGIQATIPCVDLNMSIYFIYVIVINC